MLVPGENCWRVDRAERVAFLVDADAYFAALREAVGRARDSIVIVGWDVDSRVRLGPSTPVAAPTLLALLNDALARQPGLQAFALAWDFSVIFALEREALPTYRFAWSGHPRLAFQLDGAHPVGASHHQKIVVIDDAVAFAGGLDLTIRRWDTPAHLPADPDRIDPAGRAYPPLHDVQVVVDGDAAAALGTLVRARWQAATGREIPAPRARGPGATRGAMTDGIDPWPDRLAPDARAVPVGIARTKGALGEAPAVHEIAALTVEAIASAARWIYIENQYLTSAAVGSALARRLADDTGPEIVIVLPREEDGWLEQSSMGLLRARLVHRLRQSDRHRRLRLYHPTVGDPAGGSPRDVNVHAKVMIVDDALAVVGSANLSNRSMGLDSECDLVFDAGLAPELGVAIAQLRNRLVSEHLGVPPRRLAEELAERASLIATIEGLAAGARSLVPLPHPPDPGEAALRALDPTLDLTFLDGLVCDPERAAPEQLLETFVPAGFRRPVHRSLTGYAFAFAVVLALGALWRLTPLRELVHEERIAALGRTLRGHPWAPAATLAAFLVGGVVFFPITLLLSATALVFSPAPAIALCLAGTLASAAETYGIGRLIARFRPGWLRGPRMARLQAQLQRRGVLAVVAARLLPVGNFSLINITAGALDIRFRDYLVGNALGVLPGVLALTVFAARLGKTVRHPRPLNILLLIAILAAFFAAISWLKRRLGGRR